MFKISVHRFLYKWMMVLLAFAFVLDVTGVQVAQAASLTVINTNDSGPGSLRQAIADAQPGDTIIFDSGLARQIITLTSGQLIIDKDLTITGLGADQLAISGNDASRVFQVNGIVMVTIQGLTISDGYDDRGGGIYNGSGILTVSNSTISGNRATSDLFGSGGGIYNEGTLTVNNSIFSGNSGEYGGGILNDGILTVNNSIFSSNAGQGAGILSFEMLTINNSTFHDNFSNGGGGGVYSGGTVTVNNSTFSGNSAVYPGGGIHNYGTLTVNNSTFSNNSAGEGGGITNTGALTINNSTFIGNSASVAYPGGAITSLGPVSIKNSLIADSPVGGNCYIYPGDTINAAGANFSTDDTCAGFTQVTSAQLNLGSLADNGGPTQTFALLPGSIAIDAAPDCTDYDGNPLPTDQRGVARPQGLACDVGAFELEQPTFFNFSGFFRPVDNLPALNTAKAGAAIPVKFSLDGDQGLNIFASGYPVFQKIACDSSTALDAIEQTVTAGGNTLSYDPGTDTYTYVWKTQKAWSGTCRQLIVKLSDGTEHRANFKFK